jgi:hypothetical protein
MKTEICEFLQAAIAHTPAIPGMLASLARRDGDGSVGKQFAVALFIPIITAAATAGFTAYVTQAVLADQVRALREEVYYQRDHTLVALERIQQDQRNDRDATSAAIERLRDDLIRGRK